MSRFVAGELLNLRTADLSVYIKTLLSSYKAMTCRQLSNLLDMKPDLPQRELGLMHDVVVRKTRDPDVTEVLEKLHRRLK